MQLAEFSTEELRRPSPSNYLCWICDPETGTTCQLSKPTHSWLRGGRTCGITSVACTNAKAPLSIETRILKLTEEVGEAAEALGGERFGVSRHRWHLTADRRVSAMPCYRAVWAWSPGAPPDDAAGRDGGTATRCAVPRPARRRAPAASGRQVSMSTPTVTKTPSWMFSTTGETVNTRKAAASTTPDCRTLLGGGCAVSRVQWLRGVRLSRRFGVW
jgi:hypothetical protein